MEISLIQRQQRQEQERYPRIKAKEISSLLSKGNVPHDRLDIEQAIRDSAAPVTMPEFEPRLSQPMPITEAGRFEDMDGTGALPSAILR